MTEIASIVLFSDEPSRTIDFYRAIGVELQDEDHGDGLVHSAIDVGGVHFAVFSATDRIDRPTGWRSSGTTFVGFYVPSLESTMSALRELGMIVVVGHQARSWGCRIVVEDPDGRPVEINQHNHCANWS
jgi:catechol 2,3-dioxygenase-like lactoylglutathione lyase family enzyme